MKIPVTLTGSLNHTKGEGSSELYRHSEPTFQPSSDSRSIETAQGAAGTPEGGAARRNLVNIPAPHTKYCVGCTGEKHTHTKVELLPNTSSLFKNKSY